MSLTRNLGRVLEWAARNERQLGAVLFTFGFLTDILTFGLLPVEVVNIFFLSYLALAVVCILGTHLVPIFREADVWWRKTLFVLFPLGLQYAIGGILSGFVVFYTRSSEIDVSWPFLVLVALVYAGNEYFRKHKQHVTFQTTLFFFTLYAYAIFALPLYLHEIGPWVFVWSTLAAIGAFLVLLLILRFLNHKRLGEGAGPIFLASGVVVVLMNVVYFLGVIPPLPLVLSRADVYHNLTHTTEGYVVESEEARVWWDILPQTVHHVPGTPLYVYSAIVAPTAFTAEVVHQWERYDEERGDWLVESRISFPMTGGRVNGYRGYSQKDDPLPGKWRVSIETASGQIIGRVQFTVEDADQVLLLQKETL